MTIQTTIKDYVWSIKRRMAILKRPNGKFILQQEKRLRKNVSIILGKQQAFLLKEFKDLPALNGLKVKVNYSDNQIDEILSRLPGRKAMVENIVFYSGLTMSKGGQTSVKTLGLKQFGISFDLKHPAAVKYFDQKRALELSNYRGNITSTTTDRIKQIVKEKIEKGQSYSEVAKAIQEQGDAGVFSRARAEMIATHESAVAYEEGRVFPLDDFKAKYPDRKMLKEWDTVGDENVTEECQANEDQGWIDYDEEFKSGDNNAPRSDHPRCRCTTNYEIQ